MSEPLYQLKKLLREKPQPPTRDDALKLVLALCLMAYTDGGLQEEERTLIAAMSKGLPELKSLGGAELGKLITEAAALLKPFHDRVAAVHIFKGIRSERLRQKCFLVALEAALVNGQLTDVEILALEKLFTILALPPEFAERAASTLALKYL